MSSGSDGLYLSPLSDMSPAGLTVWSLNFLGGVILFSNYLECVDFSGSFYFLLICVPFLGSWPVTTGGVRVSWTSTDVRKY